MFHTLARQCADPLVVVGPERSDGAWQQVYRSLEHGVAKNACKAASVLAFPFGIENFADIFAFMQEERHKADYDPNIRYTRPDVEVLISAAEQSIAMFVSEERKHRRAFAVWVLFQRKR
jgi:hypothetical protein